jgi:hypothetical protein
VKKISGRKRHLLVDTPGFVLKAVVVHAANLPDRDGAQEVLADTLLHFPAIERMWMDQGYLGERLKQWMVEQHLQQNIVQKPRCWCPPGVESPPMPAFTLLPHAGWWNAPLPGSVVGGGSGKIMRSCRARSPRSSQFI